MRVIINGVGVAGPTLAYWLRKAGHDVLLVENAPRLRSGGYVIDFWGVGYDVAERMGLLRYPSNRVPRHQSPRVYWIPRESPEREVHPPFCEHLAHEPC